MVPLICVYLSLTRKVSEGTIYVIIIKERRSTHIHMFQTSSQLSALSGGEGSWISVFAWVGRHTLRIIDELVRQTN